MLNDVITTTEADDTTTNTYTLVSRAGMDSVRRELTKDTNLGWKMEIKNTIDLSDQTKPNRHLISVSRGVEDAVTGEIQRVTAHCVITRHKDVADDIVEDVVHELSGILGLSPSSSILEILSGSS